MGSSQVLYGNSPAFRKSVSTISFPDRRQSITAPVLLRVKRTSMNGSVGAQYSGFPVHFSGDFHELSPQLLFPIMEDFVVTPNTTAVGEMKCSWEFEFILWHVISYYFVFVRLPGKNTLIISSVFS